MRGIEALECKLIYQLPQLVTVGRDGFPALQKTLLGVHASFLPAYGILLTCFRPCMIT